MNNPRYNLYNIYVTFDIFLLKIKFRTWSQSDPKYELWIIFITYKVESLNVPAVNPWLVGSWTTKMQNVKIMHFQENVYFHPNSQQINIRSMTSIEVAATFEKNCPYQLPFVAKWRETKWTILTSDFNRTFEENLIDSKISSLDILTPKESEFSEIFHFFVEKYQFSYQIYLFF